MHEGYVHRMGMVPVVPGYGYAATDALVVTQPSGYYADTGGYAWYYDANSGVITMVASPKSREQMRFDVNHPRWKGIYDAVIAGKNPKKGGEVYAVAAAEGGNLTSAGQRSTPGTPSAAAKPAPANAAVPGSQGSSITDKVWFWPVVILVPTVLVVGGLLLWPKKGKKKSSSRRASSRRASASA